MSGQSCLPRMPFLNFLIRLQVIRSGLEGKLAIFNHVNALFKLLKIHQFSEPIILIDPDQQRFVAEFTCEGVFLSTGKSYNQTYISVVSYDGGKITHYRDYWNPLIVMESGDWGVEDEQ